MEPTDAPSRNEIAPTDAAAPSAPPLTLDYEKYLTEIEDWCMSEDDKRDYIAALWTLLVAFAELGFDIHPVQSAKHAQDKAQDETS